MYVDKLKSVSWQKRRLQILQRDSWKCRQCGRSDDEMELQIHHKDYLPGHDPWEYPDCDLVTLCKRCHSKEQKREKWESSLLSSLKQQGFSAFEIQAMSCYLDKYEGFRSQVRTLILEFTRLNL